MTTRIVDDIAAQNKGLNSCSVEFCNNRMKICSLLDSLKLKVSKRDKGGSHPWEHSWLEWKMSACMSVCEQLLQASTSASHGSEVVYIQTLVKLL
jgi:hypothetical protein